MADHKGVVSSDYMPDSFFGGGWDIPWAGTLAPGTEDIAANTNAGAVVGTATLLTPDTGPRDYCDPQPVYQGDTSAMSDDNPAHESVIMPGPASAYVSDGPFPLTW